MTLAFIMEYDKKIKRVIYNYNQMDNATIKLKLQSKKVNLIP